MQRKSVNRWRRPCPFWFPIMSMFCGVMIGSSMRVGTMHVKMRPTEFRSGVSRCDSAVRMQSGQPLANQNQRNQNRRHDTLHTASLLASNRRGLAETCQVVMLNSLRIDHSPVDCTFAASNYAPERREGKRQVGKFKSTDRNALNLFLISFVKIIPV
jgi:hypothetical protein